jgi:hypothetical protein
MFLAESSRCAHTFILRDIVVSVELERGNVRHWRILVQVLLVSVEHHLVWSLPDSWLATLESYALLADCAGSVAASAYGPCYGWLLPPVGVELVELVHIARLCPRISHSAGLRVGPAIHVLGRRTSMRLRRVKPVTRNVVQQLLGSCEGVLRRVNRTSQGRSCGFHKVFGIVVYKSLVDVQTSSPYNGLRLACSWSVHITKLHSARSIADSLHSSSCPVQLVFIVQLNHVERSRIAKVSL